MRAGHFISSGSAGAWASTLEIGRSPVAAAGLMFGVIFTLRLLFDDAQADALCLLFVLPIALITLSHGNAAGTWAATLATGLLFLRSLVQDADYGALGVGTRTLVFYAIPLAVWLARKELTTTTAAAAAAERAGEPERAKTPKDLTRRELEVLGLIAAGHTNTEIARKLVLSVRTVESHRASLQRKLGRPSRPDLVRYALGRGLIPGEPSSV